MVDLPHGFSFTTGYSRWNRLIPLYLFPAPACRLGASFGLLRARASLHTACGSWATTPLCTAFHCVSGFYRHGPSATLHSHVWDLSRKFSLRLPSSCTGYCCTTSFSVYRFTSGTRLTLCVHPHCHLTLTMGCLPGADLPGVHTGGWSH